MATLGLADAVLYLLRASVLITIGILIGSIITETGIAGRLRFLSRPISRLSGLSSPSSLSLVAMVANPTAGKSMLAGFYREGQIRREEVVPTLLMGTFPTVLGETLFRVHFPTAVVLLGPVIGGLYTLFNLFSTLIQTAGAIIWLRFVVGSSEGGITDETNPAERIRIDRPTVRAGVMKAIPHLKRIIPVSVVATTVFFLLYAAGVVEAIALVFSPLLGLIGLPGESITAIVAQAMHFSAGYAVVGTMVTGGILTLEQALVTLIVGSMMVITMIYLKYSLPLYLSLFGVEGTGIAIKTYCASMGAKVLTIMVVIAVF
ncbi:nucleoside recognition domain-containing protein [Methanofollis fontis]|uniref:Nucleoside recognition protein n=1 Tax=Methanofollis fontis TaxID=2052832 RepID=A0A483CMS3_9EURY|nr:nucleoside recognition domain-containing protein [Methanofollis fontis]TAJ44187.1 nucleoside recognition protein [Methanofollis fontis]